MVVELSDVTWSQISQTLTVEQPEVVSLTLDNGWDILFSDVLHWLKEEFNDFMVIEKMFRDKVLIKGDAKQNRHEMIGLAVERWGKRMEDVDFVSDCCYEWTVTFKLISCATDPDGWHQRCTLSVTICGIQLRLNDSFFVAPGEEVNQAKCLTEWRSVRNVYLAYLLTSKTQWEMAKTAYWLDEEWQLRKMFTGFRKTQFALEEPSGQAGLKEWHLAFATGIGMVLSCGVDWRLRNEPFNLNQVAKIERMETVLEKNEYLKGEGLKRVIEERSPLSLKKLCLREITGHYHNIGCDCVQCEKRHLFPLRHLISATLANR